MTTYQTNPQNFMEFQERFTSEEDCEAFLFSWRWPNGFECPRCAGDTCTKLRHRRQYQCRSCKYQVSITAGTAMHRTHLPLRTWFWAMFLVARHKKGISATDLQLDLGIGSYRTAWALLHKIRTCFFERSEFMLKGLVEIDETIVGAKNKSSKRGKNLEQKSLVVAAIQLGQATKRGHKWQEVRATTIPDFKAKTLGSFVKSHVQVPSLLYVDGLLSYEHLTKEGYFLGREVSSSFTAETMREANPLRHVHLFFSNLKTWLRGRFHGVSNKYLGSYVNEFVYRLNRRHNPTENFGWVTRRIMQHRPITLKDVKLAGSSA